MGLTWEAFANLGLEVRDVQFTDYSREIVIPGQVVEIAGISSRGVAAPVAGVVRDVFVVEGQLVAFDEPLFTLEVTDEALTNSQVALLELVNRMQVVEQEIERIAPLAETGAIAGRRSLELNYERRSLLAQRDARLQELAIRGLSARQIKAIIDDQTLIKRVQVWLTPELMARLPNPLSDGNVGQQSLLANTTRFVVEALPVNPGESVERGDDLCDLSNHQLLHVRGAAFEEDLAELNQDDLTHLGVAIDFGHRHHGDHQHVERIEELAISYVDNHVNEDTQLFHFYVPLENRVARDVEDQGRVFRQWRFKPGQRAHVRIPVDQWKSQICVPRAAVVKDGLEHYVFVRKAFRGYLREIPSSSSNAASSQKYYAEFESVAVRVLHQDESTVVLARDGGVREGDAIAWNGAYLLNLATKSSGNTGSHGHGHAH